MGKRIKEIFTNHPEVLRFLLFIIFGAVVVFLTNNLFSVFAPFLIAYVATRILRPVMVKLHKWTKIPNLINTLFCMTLLSALTIAVIWLFGHYLVEGITYLINYLSEPDTIQTLINFVEEIGVKLENVAEFLRIDVEPEEVVSVVKDVATKVITLLSDVSITIAAKIPNLLLSVIIGCVAAFYMLYDYDRLAYVAEKQMSPKVQKIIHTVNHDVLTSFTKMVFSYALVSLICFVELLLGFYILGIKDAAFVALIIAVLDVLPILGSGAVLVPWGIIALLLGEPFVGVGLLVLWGIIVVIRQIIEPKIVGSQIGLHPLATLISLYVGLQLMGGLGLIMGPLYVLACKKFNETDLFKIYTKVEKEEKPKKKLFKSKSKQEGEK